MKQNMEEITKKFRQILDELEIKYEKIYLFGSRAKGNYDEDSDWDFLVVNKNTFNRELQREIRVKIRMKFHEFFHYTPVDIILKSIDTFNKEKDIMNTLSNEVYHEGIEI